jgi:hypothetical protein
MYRQPQLAQLEQQTNTNNRFGTNISALIQTNEEMKDIMRHMSDNVSELTKTMHSNIKKTSPTNTGFNFENIQNTLEKQQNKIFKVFNRMASKTEKGFNLDWIDKFEEKMAENQQEFFDKFLEDKSEYHAITYQESSLITRSANALIHRYNDVEQQQLAVLSGIYDLQRYSLGRQIESTSSKVGSSQNIIDKLSEEFQHSLLDKIGLTLKSLPMGIGAIAKPALKLLDFALDPLQIFDKLKQLPWKISSSLGLRYSGQETKTALQKTGLYSTPEQKAYTFLGQTLPLLEEEKRRILYNQLETQQNIYSVMSMLATSLTGQEHGYQQTQVTGTKFKFYDPLTGEYTDKSEHDKRKREREKAVSQELVRDRGFFKSMMIEIVSKTGIGSQYVMGNKKLAKKATSAIYTQGASEFHESQIDRMYANLEKDAKDLSMLRKISNIGLLGTLGATGGLSPIMSLLGGVGGFTGAVGGGIGHAIAGGAGALGGDLLLNTFLSRQLRRRGSERIHRNIATRAVGSNTVGLDTSLLTTENIQNILQNMDVNTSSLGNTPGDRRQRLMMEYIQEHRRSELGAHETIRDRRYSTLSREDRRELSQISSRLTPTTGQQAALSGLDVTSSALGGLGSLSPYLAFTSAIDSLLRRFSGSGVSAEQSANTANIGNPYITPGNRQVGGISELVTPISTGLGSLSEYVQRMLAGVGGVGTNNTMLDLLDKIRVNTEFGSTRDNPSFAVTIPDKPHKFSLWRYASGGMLPDQSQGVIVGDKPGKRTGAEELIKNGYVYPHEAKETQQALKQSGIRALSSGGPLSTFEQDTAREHESQVEEDLHLQEQQVAQSGITNKHLAALVKHFKTKLGVSEEKKEGFWDNALKLIGPLLKLGTIALGGGLLAKGASNIFEWLGSESSPEDGTFKKIFKGLIEKVKGGGFFGGASGGALGSLAGFSLGMLTLNPLVAIGGALLGGALGSIIGWFGSTNLLNDAKQLWKDFNFRSFLSDRWKDVVGGGLPGFMTGAASGALMATPTGNIGLMLLGGAIGGLLGGLGFDSIKTEWDNFKFADLWSSLKDTISNADPTFLKGAGLAAGLFAFSPLGMLGAMMLGGALTGLFDWLGSDSVKDAWDKFSFKDFFMTHQEEILPGTSGAFFGGAIGLLAFNPLVAIGGALLGAALGGLFGWVNKEDLSKLDTLSLIKNVASLSGLTGSVLGGALGFAAGGIVGAVVGAILGAAMGGIFSFISEEQANKASQEMFGMSLAKNHKELAKSIENKNSEEANQIGLNTVSNAKEQMKAIIDNNAITKASVQDSNNSKLLEVNKKLLKHHLGISEVSEEEEKSLKSERAELNKEQEALQLSWAEKWKVFKSDLGLQNNEERTINTKDANDYNENLAKIKDVHDTLPETKKFHATGTYDSKYLPPGTNVINDISPQAGGSYSSRLNSAASIAKVVHVDDNQRVRGIESAANHPSILNTIASGENYSNSGTIGEYLNKGGETTFTDKKGRMGVISSKDSEKFFQSATVKVEPVTDSPTTSEEVKKAATETIDKNKELMVSADKENSTEITKPQPATSGNAAVDYLYKSRGIKWPITNKDLDFSSVATLNGSSKNGINDLLPGIKENMFNMAKEYTEQFHEKLPITSAFRTVDHQAKLKSKGNGVATPGRSMHNLGAAVDLGSIKNPGIRDNNGETAKRLRDAGLLEKYGFWPRIYSWSDLAEPWHLEDWGQFTPAPFKTWYGVQTNNPKSEATADNGGSAFMKGAKAPSKKFSTSLLDLNAKKDEQVSKVIGNIAEETEEEEGAIEKILNGDVLGGIDTGLAELINMLSALFGGVSKSISTGDYSNITNPFDSSVPKSGPPAPITDSETGVITQGLGEESKPFSQEITPLTSSIPASGPPSPIIDVSSGVTTQGLGEESKPFSQEITPLKSVEHPPLQIDPSVITPSLDSVSFHHNGTHNYAKDPEYIKTLNSIESQYKLPSNILLGIMGNESHGVPGQESEAGALGLFQMKPETAATFKENPNDPVSAATGAAKYLNYLIKQYITPLNEKNHLNLSENDKWDYALHGYAAGEGNLRKYLNGTIKEWPGEGKNYSSSVAHFMQHPEDIIPQGSNKWWGPPKIVGANTSNTIDKITKAAEAGYEKGKEVVQETGKSAEKLVSKTGEVVKKAVEHPMQTLDEMLASGITKIGGLFGGLSKGISTGNFDDMFNALSGKPTTSTESPVPKSGPPTPIKDLDTGVTTQGLGEESKPLVQEVTPIISSVPAPVVKSTPPLTSVPQSRLDQFKEAFKSQGDPSVIGKIKKIIESKGEIFKEQALEVTDYGYYYDFDYTSKGMFHDYLKFDKTGKPLDFGDQEETLGKNMKAEYQDSSFNNSGTIKFFGNGTVEYGTVTDDNNPFLSQPKTVEQQNVLNLVKGKPGEHLLKYGFDIISINKDGSTTVTDTNGKTYTITKDGKTISNSTDYLNTINENKDFYKPEYIEKLNKGKGNYDLSSIDVESSPTNTPIQSGPPVKTNTNSWTPLDENEYGLGGTLLNMWHKDDVQIHNPVSDLVNKSDKPKTNSIIEEVKNKANDIGNSAGRIWKDITTPSKNDIQINNPVKPLINSFAEKASSMGSSISDWWNKNDSLPFTGDSNKYGSAEESIRNAINDNLTKSMAITADTGYSLKDTLKNNPTNSLNPIDYTPEQSVANTKSEPGNNTVFSPVTNNTTLSGGNQTGKPPLLDASISSYLDKLFESTPNKFKHDVETFAVGQKTIFV